MKRIASASGGSAVRQYKTAEAVGHYAASPGASPRAAAGTAAPKFATRAPTVPGWTPAPPGARSSRTVNALALVRVDCLSTHGDMVPR